jgi:hypothetical protein
LCFQMNIWIDFSVTVKNVTDNFLGISLNLYIVFSNMVIFTILILMVCKHGKSFCLHVLFNVFLQCFIVPIAEVSHSLARFTPKFCFGFVLEAIVNGIVFLISFSARSLFGT